MKMMTMMMMRMMMSPLYLWSSIGPGWVSYNQKLILIHCIHSVVIELFLILNVI